MQHAWHNSYTQQAYTVTQQHLTQVIFCCWVAQQQPAVLVRLQLRVSLDSQGLLWHNRVALAKELRASSMSKEHMVYSADASINRVPVHNHDNDITH